MTEKELRDAVVEAARAAGWTVAWWPKVPVKFTGQPVRWTTPIGGDSKGWLDMFLARERPLPVELKAREQDAGFHVTREQQEWIDRWAIMGVQALIWTPRDWPDNVLAELTRRERFRHVVRDELADGRPPRPPEPKVYAPPGRMY